MAGRAALCDDCGYGTQLPRSSIFHDKCYSSVTAADWWFRKPRTLSVMSMTMAAMALGHTFCLSNQQHLAVSGRSSPYSRNSLRFDSPYYPKAYARSAGRVLNVVCSAVSDVKASVDIKALNDKFYEERLQHLESQAIGALKQTVQSFKRPTFPCALITGDVVMLDLLHKIGAFENEAVKVIFIDTFHLFPETYTFLKAVEERYKFKAHVFHAAGFNGKEEYVAKHGSDLYIRDIEQYDRICKVEPFNRSLASLEVDAMINGRRRDHGAERAHLEMFQEGKMVSIQPLAYWEFRDCWNYLTKNKVPYHPLHDRGFPSIGDIQSTLPVPKEKWFEYGGERSGRFQGMTNKDGSLKTECGIHSQSK